MLTEEIRVNVRGLELAAKQWGDADLPVILALHGWLDNAATYDRLAPMLQGYRVIAMDFAGHGYSGHRPEGVRYHLLDHVDDVIGFADAMGLERFILLGHSMGAGIATYTAAAFPERVEKLILLEGIGSHSSPAADGPTILRQAVEEMKKAGAKRKPVYEAKEEAISARAQSIGGISEDAAMVLCSRGLEKVEGGYTWRSDPRVKMASIIRLSEDMVLAHLAALSMPALLIRGEQSFFAATPLLQQRAATIPQCQQVSLPGHHHLHLERDTCTAVAQAIQPFIS